MMPERTLWITACVLWMISSGLLLVVSARDGEVTGIISGILFLAGVILFVIPLVQSNSPGQAPRNK